MTKCLDIPLLSVHDIQNDSYYDSRMYLNMMAKLLKLRSSIEHAWRCVASDSQWLSLATQRHATQRAAVMEIGP